MSSEQGAAAAIIIVVICKKRKTNKDNVKSFLGKQFLLPLWRISLYKHTPIQLLQRNSQTNIQTTTTHANFHVYTIEFSYITKFVKVKSFVSFDEKLLETFRKSQEKVK